MSNFFCCCKSLALGIMKKVLQAEYQLSVSPVPCSHQALHAPVVLSYALAFPFYPVIRAGDDLTGLMWGEKNTFSKFCSVNAMVFAQISWLPDSTSSSFWGFLTLFPLHTLCSQISNSKTVHQLDRKHRSLISLMWRGAGGLYFTLHFFVAVM